MCLSKVIDALPFKDLVDIPSHPEVSFHMPEYQILAHQNVENQKQQQVDEIERVMAEPSYFEDTPVWATFRGFAHFNRNENR